MSEAPKDAPERKAPGRQDKRAAAAKDWWESLQPSKHGEERSGGGNRAALARLRRCSTWMEAAAEPETIMLFRRLGESDPNRLPRVAALAAILAQVRADEVSKIASSIGPEGGDDKTARLSPLRLRRLLTTKGDDAILTAFRRLVAMKDGAANVGDLARLILTWDSEKTRMRFAFDYWQAGAAAPRDEEPAAESAAATAQH